MTTTRRDILKFILTGSVAAGCPFDMSLLAASEESNPRVDGEHFDICHKVRDGVQYSRPLVSGRYDVIIVGGGISGLSAAYFLDKYDFLLLEKEPHFGGNAYLEEYEGQAYATGAAFDFKGSESEKLASELGLKLLPIDNPDPTILKGKWVPDTWRSGLDELPYPKSVRESFKNFKKDVLALNALSQPEKYDTEPLSKYLGGYAPEIKHWWDAYGPSNWGADSKNTSFWIAMFDFKDMTQEPINDNRVTLPGGNGAISKMLYDRLAANHREHMLGAATVVGVEQQNQEVNVTYMHGGKLQTVAAKAVIMATPKFITSLLVAGLPPAQRDAMNAIRYAPYPVVNLIFDKRVYDRGYDTWCPGNSFTDFTPADWVLRNQAGYHQEKEILTLYTPLDLAERHRLLTVEGCKSIALGVLRDFQKLLPELHDAKPVEVHLYRRGHPMFMSSPSVYTKILPTASRPMQRIFFANTDSIGPESLTYAAVQIARKGAEWTEKVLGGKPVGALANPTAELSLHPGV
ncbi:MAG TPA: FAD-dependent oxidoreductase [Candidatus Acidoferrales bacterium]|nr:FAD-dependent oxidoreductase [Candidatus Acidoferrales bacterium]